MDSIIINMSTIFMAVCFVILFWVCLWGIVTKRFVLSTPTETPEDYLEDDRSLFSKVICCKCDRVSYRHVEYKCRNRWCNSTKCDVTNDG